MAISVFDADAYIAENFIDNEDWNDAESDKKQRIINVAASTLGRKFSAYTIPDNAVYEFAAALAIVYNDTNRLNNHGIAGFSITGVGSFNFKDTQSRQIDAFIPQTAYDLIGEANGVNLVSRRVGRSVR
ncbi:hypothetical protein [Bacillus sp. ISL-37]|uniref:hypothetical protein n=1 Tax=Bacillus sp. ISL-37 TaxID=2819123 RepID=UPI001BEAE5A5|nr:hypothetical protein [Bacillus sp. ISL-37]MBT2682655.1 hypothetical protein [Bacillus sp. ISL-37]